MEKVTAMVRFYYDCEFEIEVEDASDEAAIYNAFEELAQKIKVYDGNNASTSDFSDIEIEL